MTEFFLPVEDARVLVVGDVILDRYVHGVTSRISPEAPVPVVKVIKTEERPGGAANVALNIKALGVGVQLIGITGDDDFSNTLSSLLHDNGVDYEFVRQVGFPTVTKLRVLSQNQQLLRLDYEGEVENIDVTPLHNLYVKHLVHATIIILSDYAKGSLQSTKEFITRARKKNIKVLVDPKGKEFTRYQGASYITPNLKEFEAVVGDCATESILVERAFALCQSLDLDGLLITRGEKGMSFVDFERKEIRHLPSHAHEVFDVTGAGDTVIATFAAALASSYDTTTAVDFSNLAAGLVVEKLGAASVSAKELNTVIAHGESKSLGNSLIHESDLVAAIESARSRGEKIVMTNGCFDIIHAGHVDYLRQARALGNRLLVAVNDDNSVKKLKGAGRPVNTLDNRMLVLAGLSSTDWVCSFPENTPERLIQIVKPDVLVKGGDYQECEIAGADFVKSYGGEVVTIPVIKNCSTSSLIAKLQKTSRNS